jgi:hypothetical protein
MKVVVKKNKRKELEFQFKKIEGVEDPETFICQGYCSYGPDICMKLPDPKRSGDRNFCFMDFCMSLEDTDTVPVPGSLEKLYGKMIKKEKEKN